VEEDIQNYTPTVMFHGTPCTEIFMFALFVFVSESPKFVAIKIFYHFCSFRNIQNSFILIDKI